MKKLAIFCIHMVDFHRSSQILDIIILMASQTSTSKVIFPVKQKHKSGLVYATVLLYSCYTSIASAFTNLVDQILDPLL